MEVATKRWIDKWIGIPVCAMLSLSRRCLGPRQPRPGPIGKILIVKLVEQGSTVLAYPALKAAVEMVGRERVFFLAFEENRFILDAMDVIPRENVIPVDAHSLAATVRSTLAVTKRMRSEGFDAAIDMEFFTRSSAIYTYLSGARLRVGFHSHAGEGPYRGDLMTHRLLYNPHFHTSQIFLGMVRALRHPASRSPALGIRPPALSDLPHPVFTPAASEIEAGRQLIRDLTRSRRTPPLVLVNANCSDILPLRRWAPENYVALARRLLDAYPGIVVAFTGAPDEAPHVERLLARVDSRRTICLAGRTTLRELLVLYGLSELLITNDSGPAHFATLTPIDVITLFGPETPRLFGSTSPRSHLISAGVFCSPCVSAYSNRFSRCTNNLCMQMISVDEVFAKAREILDRRVGSEVGARAVRSR